jgi:hypothetical protein
METLKKRKTEDRLYIVSHEEMSIFWEVIISVILSKKVHMYMCLNGFRDRFHCTIPKLLITKRYYVQFLITVFIVQVTKFPDCYCCNCLGERWWQGRPRSHFRKPIASVCHVTPRCEHALFLYEYFSDFVFPFLCDGWQNRATCL